MIPYWLLFCLVAAGAFGSGERQERRVQLEPLLLLTGLLLILMIGLRYDVGGDWGAYARMFQYFGYIDIIGALEMRGSEPAYGLLNWTVQQLELGIWAVNIVCGTIFTWGLLSFTRQQSRPWLALVVAVPFLVIVVGMGYTRQSAALGLFMLSLVALAHGRLAKAVVLVLMAATFHTSALVTLPLIGLSYTRNRLQTLLVIGVAGFIGYFTLLAPQWDRYTYGYIEQEYQARGAMIRVLMNLTPSLIFMVYYRYFNVDSAQKKLWRNFALAAILSFVMMFLTASTVAIDRLALYLIPIQLFVLSRLPAILSGARTAEILITLLIVLYSAAVQFTWLNYAVHSEFWIPYRTVLTAEGP